MILIAPSNDTNPNHNWSDGALKLEISLRGAGVLFEKVFQTSPRLISDSFNHK
jgi:hypothetical protein